MPDSTAISVNIRLRPGQESDGGQTRSATILEGDQVTVANTEKGLSQSWKFQRCHDQGSTQADVFAEILPLIQLVCQGKQATVFTYGATGSGKTHTMEGSLSDPGVITRSVQALFERQESLPTGDMDISLSYMEIFNNDVYDLLGRERQATKLNILNDGRGKDIVQGLSIRQLSSMAEFELLSNLATSTRKTAATALNTASSRSHAILTLHVTARKGQEFVTGRLCLADLAGSENTKIAGGNADRMRESREINTSLTTLSKVIEALRSRAAHVPYRDSKLTRVLQPALGGGSSALLICCIAPGDKFSNDTVNTLNRARQVVKHASDELQDLHDTSSASGSSRRSSSASSTRLSIDHAIRPKVSSKRRSTALTDKSNTTKSRPKSATTGKATLLGKINAAAPESSSEPLQKKQKCSDSDGKQLFEQFTEAYAQTGDEGKMALCQQLLPILGPLVRVGAIDAPSRNDAVPEPPVSAEKTVQTTGKEMTPSTCATSTLSTTGSSESTAHPTSESPDVSSIAKTLPLAVLEAVEIEIARMRTLPEAEKEAIGRGYCKKARVLLKNGDLIEANRYFRMAKGGSREPSTLTSIIADIEVNGLEGKLAQAACKRKRDA